MFLSTAETRSFHFVGLGRDENESIQALLKRWEKHCSEYQDADPDLMKDLIDCGDVKVTELEPGQAINIDSGE